MPESSLCGPFEGIIFKKNSVFIKQIYPLMNTPDHSVYEHTDLCTIC